MDLVRVDCDECGEILVSETHISVVRCEDLEADAYRLTCPECELVDVRPMDTFHANILIDAGFRINEWSLPEVPAVDLSKPPITKAEIEAFSRELDDVSDLSNF